MPGGPTRPPPSSSARTDGNISAMAQLASQTAFSGCSQRKVTCSGAVGAATPGAVRPTASSIAPRRGVIPAPSARLAVGKHADHAATSPVAELDGAGRARVQRVVFADAHPGARLKAGAALAHDDLPAGHRLAREGLDAQALGVGVAAVAAGAEPLLMSHLKLSPWWRWWSRPRPRALSRRSLWREPVWRGSLWRGSVWRGSLWRALWRPRRRSLSPRSA